MIEIKKASIKKARDDFNKTFSGFGRTFLSSFTRSAGHQAKRIAWKLTRDRLPSGGGSYINMFHTQITQSKSKASMFLRNDHEWQHAIENGTKPHTIEAKMGTVASRFARSGAMFFNYKTDAPQVPIETANIIPPQGTFDRRGQPRGYYSPIDKKIVIAQNTLATRVTLGRPLTDSQKKLGVQRARHIQVEGSFDKKGKWISKTRPVSYVQQQVTKMHELWHKYQDDSGTLAGRTTEEVEDEAYGMEAGFIATLRDTMNKGKGVYKKNKQTGKMDFSHVYDKNARMQIKNYLPGGPGPKNLKKDSNVKYDSGKPIYASKVEHPGARAFEIMEDTKNELLEDDVLDPIIKHAWDNAKRRIK